MKSDHREGHLEKTRSMFLILLRNMTQISGWFRVRGIGLSLKHPESIKMRSLVTWKIIIITVSISTNNRPPITIFSKKGKIMMKQSSKNNNKCPCNKKMTIKCFPYMITKIIQKTRQSRKTIQWMMLGPTNRT